MWEEEEEDEEEAASACGEETTENMDDIEVGLVASVPATAAEIFPAPSAFTKPFTAPTTGSVSLVK